LQIAFAFFLAIFQGFAPATGLDVIRDRTIGIILGIVTISLAFRYLWPERVEEQLRAAFAAALRNLANLLAFTPGSGLSASYTQEVARLRAETTRNIDQCLRLAEVRKFEEESDDTAEALLSETQAVYVNAALLAGQGARDESPARSEFATSPERRSRDEVAARLARLAEKSHSFLLSAK
jgi:hypothetical protein